MKDTTARRVYLIVKPFLGQKKGATNAEMISRAVEHGAIKSRAAELTQLSDDMLERAILNAREVQWLE